MQIADILPQLNLFQEKAPRSERAEIIQSFVDAINDERRADNYPKMVTGRAIAMKVGHLKNNFELYSFLSTCRDYKNRGGKFGKCFFGSLRIRE